MQHIQFIDQFRQHISAHALFKPHEPVLLAVSGGMDSVVMTHMFHLCGFAFAIAHCNFQLRGNDSDADERFVKDLAAKYNVPFYSKRFETNSYKQEHGLSLEEAARNLRYNWFEELCREYGYKYIATAHHLNDSLETALLNFTKGSGIRGLRGIPVRNKTVIRPLLFADKEQIMKACDANQLAYRTDDTNTDNAFQRNSIRNEVIPLLKKINPSLEKTFAKNVRHFTEAEIMLREITEQKIKKLVQQRRDALYIPLKRLIPLSARLTSLYEILKDHGFNEEQTLQVDNNLLSAGTQFFSATDRVIIDRNFLIITPVNSVESRHMHIEKNERIVRTADFTLELSIAEIKRPVHISDSPLTALFDAAEIDFPLLLRPWKQGDYLYPMGLYKKNSSNDKQELKPAKKKISDILTDLKIDRYEKENTWVLLSGDRIIWLAGLRQDERSKIRSSTRQVLKIKMLPGKGSI